MREDVLRGLAGDPKQLPSQYLYDDRGAELFDRICDLDEYYLTRTEFSIMRRNLEDISARIGPGALLIEPGSGSGTKARLLLGGLEEPAGYIPVDISREQLVEVATDLSERFPELDVKPVCADFTADIELPRCANPVQSRVAYMPGSTIGNLDKDDAVQMLGEMSRLCEEEGKVLIGVDLKKDRATLEAAYDDARGVSAEFALNYLVRLNRELAASFRTRDFEYRARWDEAQGRIEMALVSKCEQVVRVAGERVELEEDEPIITEHSYKYAPEEFAALAGRAGLDVEKVWTDARRWFSVQLLAPAA
jgi:dimethylhistidine N-methyltransferase